MFDLSAVSSIDVLLPYPEGVSGLGVVDLASLTLQWETSTRRQPSHPSYVRPTPLLPGHALVTAYHVMWTGILLRLGVTEAMGEEYCYEGEYGLRTRSIIGSVLDIIATIQWVDVVVELEALGLEEVWERV